MKNFKVSKRYLLSANKTAVRISYILPSRQLASRIPFFFVLSLLFLDISRAQPSVPVDKKATQETINLYKNLKNLSEKGFLFGHQDDLAYGVNWKYEKGRSDIKDVTGEYPAIYGWELGHLELDSAENLDKVPFEKMKAYIREGYERGGVITISWHFNNPLTGKSAWDPAPGTVASILPGGAKYELYKTWLDKLSLFLVDLKGRKGEFIPVIFRPFHELNGSWFWWGKNHCTPAEIKQLYQFTATYLGDSKNIHHLLYAFNTDRFASKEEYLERFPGDEWVDIIGFDIYQRGKDNDGFVDEIDNSFTILEELGREKSKIIALTEFGYNALPDDIWWTGTLLKGIGNHKIAYILGWRNAGKSASGKYEYYVPYKGHSSTEDFIKFYNAGNTFFQRDVAREKIYR